LDTDALSKHAELFTRMSQNAGFHSFEMIGNCYQGLALTMQGHAHEGLRLIRRGLERREAVGAWCYHSDIWGGMAEAQAMTGHVEEGLATLTEALTLAEETGERYFEAELYRIQSELHLRRDDELAAEDSLHKSIEVARRQKAKLWELRATTNLARLWARQGRSVEARARLQGVYDWFDEGFDTPELLAAKCFLKDLS
ncbi:MAG: adenylate cyclase, partial [Chloroflexota bacterium]